MREAVIHIRDADLEAIGLGSLCAEAGFKGFTELVCTGPGGIVAVQVDRPIPDDQLATLDVVEWWERVERPDAVIVYLLKVIVPSLPDTLPSHHELGVSNEEVCVTDHGINVSFVGSQEGITQVVDAYTEAGVPVVVRAIGDYRGPTGVLDSLTNRQHEVVHTAYDMGYYEVPSAVSIAAVATELDLDQSTVSEHLQRAERNLLTQLLGSD